MLKAKYFLVLSLAVSLLGSCQIQSQPPDGGTMRPKDDVKAGTPVAKPNQSNQEATQLKQKIVEELEQKINSQKIELEKQISQGLFNVKISVFLVGLFSLVALAASVHKLFYRPQKNHNHSQRLAQANISQDIQQYKQLESSLEPDDNLRNSNGNYVTRKELFDTINQHIVQNNPQEAQRISQNYVTREELTRIIEQQISAALDSRLRQLENNPPPTQKTTKVASSQIEKVPNSQPPRGDRTEYQKPSNTVSNLVTLYNSNPNYSPQDTLEASETQDSIERRRAGYSQSPCIEKVSRGKGTCWVVNSDGINYLLPKRNLKVTEHNYNIINVLFICHNYQTGISSDFRLLKPAQVSPLSQGENWQLTDMGELQF